ncbi:MAG: DUF488 domain-containing protein [Candidatus Bathyarchaeota archaeon]|nr:DUF488 domain-containing protein [Candidatus Bathyarchaeota archaeon]MDI6805510.1 DUF488 domain-containing protein [Candidatus Bathyarchaeia archaeon]
MKEQLRIWTIGHSNRSIEKFLELLAEHGIQVLVDIRSFPTSKIEHFKREQMENWLPQHGIEYVWLGKELGGYRRDGYKKHMRTKIFKEGIRRLLEIAQGRRACVMCMEVNPKHCHRRFISAHLERKGVKVQHIIEKGQRALSNS